MVFSGWGVSKPKTVSSVNCRLFTFVADLILGDPIGDAVQSIKIF